MHNILARLAAGRLHRVHDAGVMARAVPAIPAGPGSALLPLSPPRLQLHLQAAGDSFSLRPPPSRP